VVVAGRLLVSYSGPSLGQPVYRCERRNQMLGLPRCFTFGGLRVDAAIAGELFWVVDPMANGAAMEAEQRYWRESGVVTGVNAYIRAAVRPKSEQGFDAARMVCGFYRDDWCCATSGSASSSNPCSRSCVHFSLAGALVANTGHRLLRVVLGGVYSK
jgi:hypothetical protein